MTICSLVANTDQTPIDYWFKHRMSTSLPQQPNTSNPSTWPHIYTSVVFWPSTRPKMPFRVMHRKEVTHSNGSYERKSRGRKLSDEMGRGKKKFPWCTHRLMHRKRVTCELHDSYFRWMTINHAISKIE